jgi:hypothetical protein
MPQLVFGVGVAKPAITGDAADRGWESADLVDVGRRNGLADAFAVLALVCGLIHVTTPPKISGGTPDSMMRAAKSKLTSRPHFV